MGHPNFFRSVKMHSQRTLALLPLLEMQEGLPGAKERNPDNRGGSEELDSQDGSSARGSMGWDEDSGGNFTRRGNLVGGEKSTLDNHWGGTV